MNPKPRGRHRIERLRKVSLGVQQPERRRPEGYERNATVDCGWGKLIFAHTFDSNEKLAETICDEPEGERNLALYLRDPHVVLALAPQELFLDPSHTYRLWLESYLPSRIRPEGFVVRRLQSRADAEDIHRLLLSRGMVTPEPEFIWDSRKARAIRFFVAEDTDAGRLVGTVMGVDHKEAFGDPDNGSSMWCLAVDPQARAPGVGRALVAHIADYYAARGRSFMDLSVMHDNNAVIKLYEKLGFVRIPVFCVKRKNAINEPLFIGPRPEEELNPYARIIVDEALRRGIAVDVLDAAHGYFALQQGGRRIVCRESLSELTTAVAMSRCDHKAVTRGVLDRAGVRVPRQRVAGPAEEDEAFLEECGRLVVKPAQGEQGRGVRVNISDAGELAEAVADASRSADEVLLEEYVPGEDLRVVLIDYKVVAAAVRTPPSVVGTGQLSIRELIEKQSRRRAAATGGESTIPLDAETGRCLRQRGYGLDDVLPEGETVQVRETANLHTGGILHDVTERLSPELARVCERAARALGIPVVGLDLLVPAVDGEEYVVIEANERPGLANHEPQPTAQRFLDFLFPHSGAAAAPGREGDRDE